ncbi:DUF2259 domain-containing protein [Sinorhizobium sp. BG8]|uniref:DUF2259 domain-containing protein n=1 Tax=Sinorhizobium sp. BG8 TaxID=2613773 RepID=UPI00193CE220|nr:DUF2259 domain-containing protein [Sinorhizobium sp. BG8]
MAATLLALPLAGQGHAGDFAHFQPIGFSADGKVFAYEEFGIEDGSGSAYSTVYFVDTVKDAYLPDTPLRVRLEEGHGGLAQARSKTAEQARPLVEEFEMRDHPGQVVALNPYTELGPAPNSIRYYAFPMEPRVGKPYTLALSTITLPAPERCKPFLDKGVGFRLELTERSGTPTSEVVHEDTRVPDSRRCPTGYRMAGVVTGNHLGNPVHVAMIMVLSLGFEGSDGRWIAVPVRPGT